MPKLEIEFEITGLKLRIKGESEDVVERAADVQRRLHGAFQALGSVGEGALSSATQPRTYTVSAEAIKEVEAEAPRARRTTRKSSAAVKTKNVCLELTHDPEKFGFPKQEWPTASKAMWFLLMLEKQTGHKEASAPEIAGTFNKYFREFGTIRPQNISRDLSALKGKGKSVNNDPAKEPPTWYLLEDGKKEVENLIAATRKANQGDTE
jgi:hypothetical protein